MKNFVQKGDTLEVEAPYDVASGGMVKVGSIFGIAAIAVLAGELVNIDRFGVFSSLKKKAGDTFADGAPVYFETANQQLTSTAAGNLLVGASVGAYISTDVEMTALLSGDIRPSEASS